MLTKCAQLRCKLSLWLQVISLPLLCRKYQQTLEISRGTWLSVLLFLRTATVKLSWMLIVIDLALNWQLFSDVGRPRSFVNWCPRTVLSILYQLFCVECFVNLFLCKHELWKCASTRDSLNFWRTEGRENYFWITAGLRGSKHFNTYFEVFGLGGPNTS